MCLKGSPQKKLDIWKLLLRPNDRSTPLCLLHLSLTLGQAATERLGLVSDHFPGVNGLCETYDEAVYLS